VIGRRLRRALRTACMRNGSKCLNLDSEYEAFAEGPQAEGPQAETLSELERSLKPVGRRAVAAAFLRADFCLVPPLRSGPARAALFDALLAGCIPVFFSTCLDPRLAVEALYPHFLPPHARGNLTAPAVASSARHRGSMGAATGGEDNDGFGVGRWAVLVDARGLGLLADGEGTRGGDDGSLDDPKENARRADAARRSVLDFLASVPAAEKRRLRRAIADVIPRIQYALRPGQLDAAAAAAKSRSAAAAAAAAASARARSSAEVQSHSKKKWRTSYWGGGTARVSVNTGAG